MCWRFTGVVVVLWLLGGGVGEATAGNFAYSGSLQYATGHYALEERTTSLYLFNGLRWGARRWAAQVNVPFVLQSPSGAVPMMDATVGVGDAFLRLEGDLVRLRGSRPSVRLAAEVKAPLSRTHPSFGTGEWDVGGGVSLAERVGGNFVFLDATYWMFGDPPGIDLRDALAYGLSFGRPMGRLGVLASVTGYSRLLTGVDPPVQAGLFLSWWMRSQRSLSVGAVFGLTDAAPDGGVSLGWRVGI